MQEHKLRDGIDGEMRMNNYRNQEDINKFVAGEKIAQAWMNKEYPLLGYDIKDRKGQRGYDLILCKDEKLYKTEEKFRTIDYGDFLVEIFQCMIKQEWGWLYKTEVFEGKHT